eukprot:g8671.t1
MHIWNLNAKRAFSEAFNANVAETEAAFRQRRHTMDNAWDEVDQHCKALGKRMMEVGIAKPSGSEEAMLRLNVGGAPVNIRRSALEGRGHLGSLFESVWDKRLPRDADGLIVVDLSPKCLKHVIHTLLSSRDADSTKERLKSGDGLPADEKVYFPYLASAIGLAERPAIKVIGGCTPPARPAIKVIGGSTVMEGDDLLPMSSALLNWCPGQPAALELVYRATRDGWTPQAFHARCGADSPYTITLYRVPVGVNSTVVGGFSSASWALTPVPTYRSSPEAFLFMLKDGTMPQWGPFLPFPRTAVATIRSFGVFVADSLMEERTALGQAHDELSEASANAAASSSALAAMYGPEVAAGVRDPVVELSVRGTRMTTLRSTLQACPDSALAVQFDEAKWPATEKDVDERGRRVMDCSPAVFGKVLDVLRMRKRASWASGFAHREGDVRVAVKAADRAAFEAFVDMYFPGCQGFIMNYVVDAPLESTAGR